jgi:hypothetical protein
MKFFKLIRIAGIQDGTFGVLLDEKTPFCLTVERPWLNNRKNESCIPDGEYLCKRVKSPRFGNTFEVNSVPDRTAILFHKGNIEDDTHGCVIVGEQYESLNGKIAVLASGKAMQEFLERTAGIQEFLFLVMWASK